MSVSVFIGIGAMFVPLESFASLSPTLASIFSYGLVFVTIIAMIFEQLQKRRSKIKLKQRIITLKKRSLLSSGHTLY